MNETKRRVRDVVSIKRTIWSNYERFRTLPLFYLERNEVLARVLTLSDEEIASIAAECREGGVRWRGFTKHLSKIESALLGDREVVDLSQSDERAFETIGGVPAADFVRVIEKADGAAVSFAVNGRFDVLCRGNRNGCCEIRNMAVDGDTVFTAVNELLPFWEDKYSVALKSENLSVAISAEDPKTGKKGGACIRITVIENGRVVTDDLGKYTDVSPLTLWVTP